MPDSEILHHLPGWVFWLFAIAIFVLGMLSRLVQGKKDFLELFGRPGRWLYHRLELAATHAKNNGQREAFDTPEYRMLKRRIDAQAEEIKDLQANAVRDAKRIKSLENRAEHDAERRDIDAEFIREDAQWHADVAVWAVGKHLRLPTRIGYIQFVREYWEKHPKPTESS